MKRTLKRELKVLEIAERETVATSVCLLASVQGMLVLEPQALSYERSPAVLASGRVLKEPACIPASGGSASVHKYTAGECLQEGGSG